MSASAIALIVAEEVSDRAYYDARCRHFEWPKGASGPTVGIGYDCGYVTRQELVTDWQGIVPDATISALLAAVGIKGEAAGAWVRAHGRSVTIDYDTAMRQFREREWPKWCARVRASLPRFDELPSDCAGALVSLAYNRGCSWDLSGDRYAEMRAIKAHMASGDWGAIPGELRSMARLWTGAVHARRHNEAALFERGLAMLSPAVPAADDVQPDDEWRQDGRPPAPPNTPSAKGDAPERDVFGEALPRRRSMAARAPIAHMGQSTSGNTSVAIGAGAGVPQVGMAAGEAAAQSTTPKGFVVALLMSPLFWTGVLTIAGAAYIWVERWRKFRTLGI